VPFSGPQFSSQRDPKGLPKGAPKCIKVQQLLKKSAANSGLEIGPEKGGRKSENRAAFNLLARFSRFPGIQKNMQNRSKMEPTIDTKLKISGNWANGKKQAGTKSATVCK